MPDELQSLSYAVWNDCFLTEKPYVIVSDIPGLTLSQKTNITFAKAPEEIIHDIRGREDEFTLDKSGFAFIKHNFPDFDVSDAGLIASLYEPAVEKFLKENVEGVDRVKFFDYRIRLNTKRPQDDFVDIANTSVALPPAIGVHIDQSAAGVLKRVRTSMGDESDFLLRGRTRILNVWRPYDHEIEDCPLALCDGSTIREEHMLITDQVTKAYTGEAVYPMYNPDVKWYYLSRQRKDEVLVLKIFDSDETVMAKGTPHTAFVHQDLKPDVKPRKTLEIRALVFTYPEA